MKVETEIISVEIVTPSSPTPNHLRNYKLSFLDQIMSNCFVPLVLFFPANETLISHSERSNHLKKSLSKALTLFYPLAGRIVGNHYINCNDVGVTYLEAQANCELSEFLITDPSLEEINKFAPCYQDYETDIFFVVQVTFFGCGGMAIGWALSHKVGDASCHFMFARTWTAISRGDELIQSPIFESATLFPPRDLIPLRDSSCDSFVIKEKFVTKRFQFTAANISMLRDKYSKHTTDEGFIRPTRIEALSVFIWNRFMVATGAKSKVSGDENETNKLYALLFYVDIRNRLAPPLSEKLFGNILLRAFAMAASLDNEEENTYGLVKKIRDAVRDVNLVSIAKISERDESLEGLKIQGRAKMEVEGKLDVMRFSSICRSGLYQTDFGWGKTVWFGLERNFNCKMVYFMDSISGDGIDVMVHLNVDDMIKFAADQELNMMTCHLSKI